MSHPRGVTDEAAATPKAAQGFTHVVVLSFRTEKDRAAFLADPVHKRYQADVLDAHLEKALVVEFTRGN